MKHLNCIQARLRPWSLPSVVHVFAPVVLTVLAIIPCLAQAPPDTTTVQPNTVPPSVRDLNQMLQRIEENSKRLQDELKQPTQTPSETAPHSESEGSAGHQDSVSKIRERIKLLKRFRQQHQTNSQPVEKLPLPQGVAPANSKTTLPQQQMLQIDSPPPSTGNSNAASSEEISATRIMPKPVNTLEMGNSIFMTGNYQAALDAFDKVDESKLTAEDTLWLHAMKAACHRRLKSGTEANGFYREISNAKVNGASVKKNAEFWLKYNESKARNQQVYDSIDQDLALLLERVNERIKKSR